jgi:hypothetical protein
MLPRLTGCHFFAADLHQCCFYSLALLPSWLVEHPWFSAIFRGALGVGQKLLVHISLRRRGSFRWLPAAGFPWFLSKELLAPHLSPQTNQAFQADAPHRSLPGFVFLAFRSLLT